MEKFTKSAQAEPSASTRGPTRFMSDDCIFKALELAGCPRRFLGARVSDFNFEAPHPNDSGLFLTGAVGVGKSHLAAAVLADMAPELTRVENIYSYSLPDRSDERVISQVVTPNAFWVSIPMLLLRLKRTFSKKTTECEKDILDEMVKPQLLILDDLGSQMSTDWSDQNIFILISARLDKCRPSIITSNLGLANVHEVDERLASRLGGMTFHKMTGPDRRLLETEDEAS